MSKIVLGKVGSPLDWSALQRVARRVLGRQLVVPAQENDFLGEQLSPAALHALGFKVAANPRLAQSYLLGQTLSPTAPGSVPSAIS